VNHSLNNECLKAALSYIQMGFAVFPCRPGRKEPLTEHGFKDATVDPQQVREWWDKVPTVNVAIATGSVSNLLVIDVDSRNDGESGLDKLRRDHGNLPQTPLVITGGGRHIYLRHPGGQNRCSTGELAPGIDIKADGGYVVAPPSLHPSGPAYRWDKDYDIANVRPSAAPAWLIEQLAQMENSTRHGPTSRATGGNVIPDGQRNNALASLAGGMRRMGMGYGEILAALQVTNQARCRPPLDDTEIEQIAASITRYEPDAVSVAIVENHYAQMFDEPAEPSPQSPGPFPIELIDRAPDIVKLVMDYYESCAVGVQPVLMLASLIAATGAVLGHKVRDASGLRTNIYTLGVGGTGSGKEATREVIRKIFQHADIDPMCGPEDFASDAGVIAVVEKQNPVLFQIDEFGRMMRCVNAGPLKNPHLYNVGSVLLKFYGKANSVFRSKAYADIKRNKIIRNPHVCLYATTVKDNFWRAMNIDSLEGGFLPRLLIFADYEDPQPGQAVEAGPPPPVAEFFAGWANRHISSGNLEQARTSTIHPQPMLVTYTPDARVIMDEFQALQKLEQKQHKELGVLWSRARENAGKLALIYAAWKNSLDVLVDAQAAQWAVDVNQHCIQHAVYEAHLCLSEGPFHERCNRILRALEGTSQHAPMMQQYLCRKTQRISPRERNEAVQALVEQGRLAMSREKTATKPRTVWHHRDRPSRPSAWSVSAGSARRSRCAHRWHAHCIRIVPSRKANPLTAEIDHEDCSAQHR